MSGNTEAGPVIDGTSLLRVKQELIEKLQARVPNVLYQSPQDASDVLGEDGSGVCVWWDDTTEATIEPIVFGLTQWDERYTATLIIQALGRDTDDDQESIDTLATRVLGETIGLLTANTSLGIADDADIQVFEIFPAGWRNITGLNGANRAGRFEFDISVHARLSLQ